MYRILLSTALAAFAMSAAGTAAAGVITTRYTPSLSTLHSTKFTLNSGGSWTSAGAGRLAFTVVSATEPGFEAGDILYSYCIEPYEWVQSLTTYNVDPLAQGTTLLGGMGATKANSISQLFARFQPDLDGTVNAIMAAALQFAVWEIVAENSATFSLTGGNARFVDLTNAASITLGQSFLNALTPGGPTLGNLRALNKRGVQDELVQVPEPASLGLLGLGLAGIAAGRRRRSRSA